MPAGKRTGLVGDALLQTPLAAEDVGVVVDYQVSLPVEFCGKIAFRKGKAHGACHALTERARTAIDARSYSPFGMTGSFGAELPEVLQIFLT